MAARLKVTDWPEVVSMLREEKKEGKRNDQGDDHLKSDKVFS